jgi:hypothetical protein
MSTIHLTPASLNAALAAMGIAARIPDTDPEPVKTFTMITKAANAAAVKEAKAAASAEGRVARLNPTTAGNRAGLLVKVRLLREAGLADDKVKALLPKAAGSMLLMSDTGAQALAERAAQATGQMTKSGKPTAAALGGRLLKGLLALAAKAAGAQAQPAQPVAEAKAG